MRAMAHPDDVLIVGRLDERRLYPQFAERQVVSANSLHRMLGRRVRRAYFTPLALLSDKWWQMEKQTKIAQLRSDQPMSFLHVSDWQPEPGLIAQLEALPEQTAMASRDFGRGYAQAIRDAIKLVGASALEVSL